MVVSNIGETYTLKKEKAGRNLKFVFMSVGTRNVVKAVQYTFLGRQDGVGYYNLGFGDYDIEHDEIIDSIDTNNGDHYKVFNTVLNTIPSFFKMHPTGVLMVRGSDSRPGFPQNCKMNCQKKCIGNCKNFNRRIKIYQHYISKNFDQLTKEYEFTGGRNISENENITEDFKIGNSYDVIFLKKNP